MLRALKRERFVVRRLYSTKLSEKSSSAARSAFKNPGSISADGDKRGDLLSHGPVDQLKPVRERQNYFGIPLISESLEKILFGASGSGSSGSASDEQLQNALEQLRSFGIQPGDGSLADQTSTSKLSFQLPILFGDVESHFYRIGQNFVDPFLKLIVGYVEADLPEIPAKWEFRSGWTRYDPADGSTSVVPCPLEDIYW